MKANFQLPKEEDDHTERNNQFMQTQRLSLGFIPQNKPIVKNLARTATTFREIISQHNPFEK